MTASRSLPLLLAATMLASLSGCASRGIKVREGSLPPADASGEAPVSDYTKAEIVHVDTSERLATIEHEGLDFDAFEYVLSFDPSGEPTGVLRPDPETRSAYLIRAVIFEGQPEINDRVGLPGAKKLAELKEKYRDPLAGGD